MVGGGCSSSPVFGGGSWCCRVQELCSALLRSCSLWGDLCFLAPGQQGWGGGFTLELCSSRDTALVAAGAAPCWLPCPPSTLPLLYLFMFEQKHNTNKARP